MRKFYVVMVTIPFGFDDTYFCEYSGIEHKTKKLAIYHPDVKSALIYEVYR